MKIIAGLCLFGMIGNACGGSPQDMTYSALEPAAGETRPYYRDTPAGSYLASQFAQNQQDWKKAEEYLSRVLEHDPDNSSLQRRAMILAMGAGETSRAIANARKIVQTDPKNDLALLIVTLDQLARGNYGKAQTTLKQMQTGSVGELIAPVLSAWASSAGGTPDFTGMQDMAFHDYHRFLITDYLGQKDQLPALADKLMAAWTLDNYIFDKVTKTLARNGYNDKAVAMYRTAAKSPETELNDLFVEEKIAALSQKDRLGLPVSNPAEGAGEALFDMARLMLREGSRESARIFTRMALHLYPNSDEAQLVMATLLAQDERYTQSIDYLRNISSDSPLYPDAQRQAAALLDEEGKSDEAIAILQDLYESKNDINALITIGDIQRNREEYEAAIETYNMAEKAIGKKRIPAQYWGLLYVRGMAYERIGDIAKAERDLKAALVYQPDHPYLLNYLGYTWTDAGRNLNEALKLLERAATLQPDDGYITDSLGWTLFKMKRYEEAIPYLEKAVSLLPYDPEINDHLGDAYWQVGRRSEARYQWERAANNSKDADLTSLLRMKIVSGLNEQGEPPVREAAAKADDPPETPAQP